MMMQRTWEDARTEARADDVLTVLRVRGIAVRQRIETERNSARLVRWLERAAVATSITEVVEDAT
jgi:hypothetical protein